MEEEIALERYWRGKARMHTIALAVYLRGPWVWWPKKETYGHLRFMRWLCFEIEWSLA